jgi:hypothetical protein
MTGRRGSNSSWLPDLAIPVALVASEAAWFSLLVAGRARVHDRVAMDVPYLAVALPAAVAVVVLAWGGRFRGRRSLILRWVGGIVGAALTAAVLSESTVSGSFLTVASHPWTSGGHTPATVAGIAWFVAIVVWARGAWLAWSPVPTRQVGWSLALGAVAYMGIFIGRAAGGHGPFVRATGDAGILFFLSFLLGGAAFAFARQRDIEADAVPGSRSRPNLVVGGAVALPLAFLGLVGVAVAFVGGPAASLLGAGIRLVGHGVARALVFLFSWIPALHLKGRPVTQRPAGLRTGQRRLPRSAPPSHTAEVIALVILGIVAVALIVAILVVVKRHWPKRRHKEELDEADEEQDSVFSWSHVLAQLRAGLRRLIPRRRRRRTATAAAASAAEAGAGFAFTLPEPDSVREVYRRMLVETRTLGSPRRRAETTVELEARLTARVGDPAAVSLRRLTAVYDDVRYGGRETDVAANRVARQDVDEVLPALRHGLAPPAPDVEAQPGPARGRTLTPLPARRRWWRRRGHQR